MIIFNHENNSGIIFNFMATILDRIQEIAQNEGISIGALERQIGASKGVLSRAINNGTDIQSKWIQILVENYPLYSAEWLLTGRGVMRKTNCTQSSKTPSKDLSMEFSRKEYRRSHSLLQGIFPTQGSNLGLPALQADSLSS